MHHALPLLLAPLLLACAGPAGSSSAADAPSPAAVGAAAPSHDPAPTTGKTTLISNVRVWDGKADDLTGTTQVLVQGDRILAVGEVMPAIAFDETIDGQGMTLMPGLIDSHVHLTHSLIPEGLEAFEAMTWEEIGAGTATAAREFLMSGFTTVRDMGGMGTGFKRQIDRGYLTGPRIYAAGAYVTQTSGHGDFRLRSQANGQPDGTSNLERLGVFRLADGVDEVRRAVRENFAEGTAYCKVMAGGGVSSAKDPLHTLQYTAEEIAAAVQEAEHWDTYIAVHVYNADAVARALELGVRCIDHAHFIDEPAMRLLKEKDAFLSTNLVGLSPEILDHPVYGDPSGPQYAKAKLFPDQRETFVGLVKKHRPRQVYNTDIVFSTPETFRKARDNNMWLHAEWFGNAEALRAMTSVGGELAAETGKNNPYPGKLGVIEPGAYADLLLVDGNPLEDITVLGAVPKVFDDAPVRGETVETIRLIMKGGVVFKDTLE